jgi:phasin family protein
MAAKFTERSAQQCGRSLGLTGDDAERTAQSYSDNLSAILQSSAMLADMTQGITREWLTFGRNRLEENFERFDQLLHSRTPQNFIALQSAIMKSNLEEFLGSARRVAEKSMRTTDDLAKRFDDAADQSRRAA